MLKIFKVCFKEFNSFFSTPAAWLFLGAFLLVNLFTFFWGEAFFARNIADMKPLFKWMPVLLIFLVAALTMRSWSEERRAGTLESLLTSPVSPVQLVLGKFFAAFGLVFVALLLTVPLAITVFLLGPLDWGPVIGGYVASLFLAAAYIAIGLNMSSRTDNPIVALILTVAVAGFFYLIGSPLLTTLFGHSVGGFMELLGTGSRFDAITRGVLDVRDICYYLSLVGIFLSLNLYSLERIRWAGNVAQPNHKRVTILTVLAVLNCILVNIWLHPIGWVRMDLTQGKMYSLSDTTKKYLELVQEPLLIRGYFSEKSHPLLEPLVPQIKDLLKEYQVAGGDKVRVEFVDPHTDQTLEQEAAEKFNIRPVPFRMASRYEAGVVNSYFNLAIVYGDQFETLSFDDLIDVKAQGTGEPEVLLKNPEYAITSSLRKVSSAYRSGGNVFAHLQQPLTFHGYISADQQLPEVLVELKIQLIDILEELKQQSGDKLSVSIQDPDANGGQLGTQLNEQYGYEPQIASLFDPKPFWFYMQLQGAGETVQVPLPGELNREDLKRSIESAVQRMAPGYLKTIALVTPPAPQQNPYMPVQPGKRYGALREMLAENVRVKDTDLKEGQVPADADLLLLLGPENLDENQLFALDQFLMQGGTVVAATSAYDVSITNTLQAKPHHSGLEEWLLHNGLTIEKSMVLDPQNASLPVPVQRQIGPLTVNEIQMMPYPHFPDIRGAGMNADNPVTANLGQLTLNWASPLLVDKEKNHNRKVEELLHSSPKTWTSDVLNILPDYDRYPDSGFSRSDAESSELLAVAVSGGFTSFFEGKQSPLLSKKDESQPLQAELQGAEEREEETKEEPQISGVIKRSSDSARLILISSNSFASDKVISLMSQGSGTPYLKGVDFLQNAIDWSLDDQGLMSIRSRAQFARMLVPMGQSAKLFWEYLNYGLALAGLGLVWGWRSWGRKRRQRHYAQVLAEV
ncbi:MAG: ABC transporter permease [Desulfobulbus propionicus]|nr:MAG: ABC transporter permease [Desulfobulbus propionicus]